jgi:undecaprenyl-diphosphatase
LGSVAAVVAYFRRDLIQVLKGISRAVRHGQWREPDARLGVAMLIGTLPILVLGLGIKFFWHAGYASSPLRSVPSIAIVSIVMALFLALAERMGPRLKQLGGVTGRDGFVVGLAQALAVIQAFPGQGAPSQRRCLMVGNGLMQPVFHFCSASLRFPLLVWWS